MVSASLRLAVSLVWWRDNAYPEGRRHTRKLEARATGDASFQDGAVCRPSWKFRPFLLRFPCANHFGNVSRMFIQLLNRTGLSVAVLVFVVSWSPAQIASSIPDGASQRLPRTNLLVYHDRKGEVRSVKTKSEWLKRRAEIIRGFAAVAGPLPGKEKRCRLDMRVDSVTDCGSYERWQITYQSEPGSRVPAFLCIPNEALHSSKKFPAVLCLHPTDMQYGNRVVVEKLREHYPAYAADLAERGFVTLAPAYPVMANYQPDLKTLGWQSGTLKAVWDNIRGLDLLDSTPFVKRGKYGAIGHSLGGHNAIYTAVSDSRIKVIVTSCGFDSFLDYYDGDPANWQPERGWCQTRYMLKLADYRGRLTDIPFDFHELLGALAPRTVFINAPLGDSNFRARSVDEVVKAASAVYHLYGAEKDLHVEHPPRGHDFPEQQREQAYRLLEERLR